MTGLICVGEDPRCTYSYERAVWSSLTASRGFTVFGRGQCGASLLDKLGCPCHVLFVLGPEAVWLPGRVDAIWHQPMDSRWRVMVAPCGSMG